MPIKGPKSALTTFLKEKGIKINFKRRKEEIVDDIVDEIVEDTKIKRNRREVEGTSSISPFELINYEENNPTLKKLCLKKILENNLPIDTNSLKELSQFIANSGTMNIDYFNYLISNFKNEVFIYDCSMIKDENFKFVKKFQKIEFHFCGQLTETTLNYFIDSPETLILKGSFQIKSFNLPKRLKVLDLSESKIEDSFIEIINCRCQELEELVISRCLNLKNSVLKLRIKKLDISNTYLTTKFIKHFNELIELNINNCNEDCNNNCNEDCNEDCNNNCNKLNNFDFSKLKKIEKLEISGSKTTNFKLPTTCNYLNISGCNNLTTIPLNDNLKYLNISNTNFKKIELIRILNLKELKVLDLSWIEEVDDEFVFKIVNTLNLSKLFLFGCFGLTEKVGELGWRIKEKTLLIGNPSETKYLLRN